MKIHFLGTCAGTEPMPDYKHVSFIIEKDGLVYWFDAGEGCSYTAHNMGIDLLATECVFVSHTHMDHVGGLGNLFWNIRKINSLQNNKIEGKKIELFIPNFKTWEGIMQVLSQTEGNFKCDFSINPNSVSDGVLYNHNDFKVTSFHNYHLEKEEDGIWRSFSFLIETEGKKIVYSGDVKSMLDIDEYISNCNLLLMETGHHKVENICNYIKNNNKKVETLGFIHHGRDILKNKELELSKAINIMGDHVFIAKDGMTIEL